jgi:hypothetical protein
MFHFSGNIAVAMARRWASLALALCVACAAAPAWAGRSCEAQPLRAQTVERALRLAEDTARALDASGAQVVVLARAGQDLSAYGLRYSHLGWAYKSTEGPWRVVHKLNACGTAQAHLYRQGLGDFFLDDLWRMEAVWQVPVPAMQKRLWLALQDRARVTALQHEPYNMVSYAWGTRYQQSNQWALETLALAMEPGQVHNREQAQAWLRQRGYVPTTLRLSPLTRLGGRMTAANIAFDDHPSEKRFAGRIETVTVDSVLQWLQRLHGAQPPQALRLGGSTI